MKTEVMSRKDGTDYQRERGLQSCRKNYNTSHMEEQGTGSIY